jgi:hypothetical protein
MQYDTTIQTRTKTERISTCHINEIDWEYDFDNPAHTECQCNSEEYKREYIARKKDYLKQVENGLNAGHRVLISTYGGWPRIWRQAHSVGMVSTWPYWSPRPNILANSTVGGSMGTAWEDWNSITGVEVLD